MTTNWRDAALVEADKPNIQHLDNWEHELDLYLEVTKVTRLWRKFNKGEWNWC